LEALLPAFVAAFLAEWGDKTQLVVVALALRFGRPGSILVGVALGAVVGGLLAGFGGGLVHDAVTLRALSLLLGLALLFAGASAFFARKVPAFAAHLPGPPVVAAALGVFLAEFGDRTQFVTFALAARYDSILLAAFGAAAGILAAGVPVAVLGPRLAQAVPVKTIRLASAGLFLVIGVIVALNALRLV
jgi:putative Ca2+/H+ antiporter (TMEM165/GDT1 family)